MFDSFHSLFIFFPFPCLFDLCFVPPLPSSLFPLPSSLVILCPGTDIVETKKRGEVSVGSRKERREEGQEGEERKQHLFFVFLWDSLSHKTFPDFPLDNLVSLFFLSSHHPFLLLSSLPTSSSLGLVSSFLPFSFFPFLFPSRWPSPCRHLHCAPFNGYFTTTIRACGIFHPASTTRASHIIGHYRL